MSEQTAVEAGMVTVDRRKLLEFFDEAPVESDGHSNAIVAVAGEELALALLVDYLDSIGEKAELLTAICTQGRKRGYRLDGWVETESVLYQVEVKNWSAHSFGGKRLTSDLSTQEVADFRKERWGEVWNGSLVDCTAAKVLRRMKPPHRGKPIEPLVVFWMAMHPLGEPSPFFQTPVEGKAFDRLNVFSMSNYLRGLPQDTLELHLPKTRSRLLWLAALFGCGALAGTTGLAESSN